MDLSTGSSTTERFNVENNHLSLPNGLINHAQVESSLGMFMAQNGASADEISLAQADLAKGLGTGASQPATELVKKWALLMSSAATLGTGTAAGIGGAVTGGVVGGVANTSTQLTINGDKPFSYADALAAIGTGALSQGKGAVITGGISIGGAYVGSTIKGEDPQNAMIGAGLGSAAGSGVGKVVTDNLKPIVSDNISEAAGTALGSVVSEVVGSKAQDKLGENK